MRAPMSAPVFISALVSLTTHGGSSTCSLRLAPEASHLSVLTQLTMCSPAGVTKALFVGQRIQKADSVSYLLAAAYRVLQNGVPPSPQQARRTGCRKEKRRSYGRRRRRL